MMTPCPNCGWPHHSPIPITLKCAKCGTVVEINGGGNKTPKSRPRAESVNTEQAERLKELGRRAWKRLHQMQNWSPEAIQSWLESVPSISCDCRAFARKYVAENPPPHGDLAACRRWSFDFHCAVDRKVGDTPMSWKEATRRWGWSDEVK